MEILFVWDGLDGGGTVGVEYRTKGTICNNVVCLQLVSRSQNALLHLHCDCKYTKRIINIPETYFGFGSDQNLWELVQLEQQERS